VHDNDTVTIVATDVAGNKTEQLINCMNDIITFLKDNATTGLLDNDGVTSNGLITVNGLETGATWQYSISGDDGFVDGTGSSSATSVATMVIVSSCTEVCFVL
jgi:hypothetical protein